ncbi:hypothetical protein FSP39_017878 [Pinctada imbricata]|uniref:Uncharacterized protein n=1 Tax=Pinctada imbricata TaxID=66713 RepID=A0AA88YK88_PINIB|nr:hypothetical protein FSP39_017878 [Pinctada imbricata]
MADVAKESESRKDELPEEASKNEENADDNEVLEGEQSTDAPKKKKKKKKKKKNDAENPNEDAGDDIDKLVQQIDNQKLVNGTNENNEGEEQGAGEEAQKKKKKKKKGGNVNNVCYYIFLSPCTNDLLP